MGCLLREPKIGARLAAFQGRGAPAGMARSDRRLPSRQHREKRGLDPAAFLPDNDFMGLFKGLGRFRRRVRAQPTPMISVSDVVDRP